jgi:hypothetical protein
MPRAVLPDAYIKHMSWNYCFSNVTQTDVNSVIPLHIRSSVCSSFTANACMLLVTEYVPKKN